MDKAISEIPCISPKAVDLISDGLPFGRLCYGRPGARGRFQRVVSGLFASGHARYQQFSACSRRDSSLKRCYKNNWGRPFEHEDTNPKHQYGSIRLAPSQKEHKRRHNS
jgi:hypothetical protein